MSTSCSRRPDPQTWESQRAVASSCRPFACPVSFVWLPCGGRGLPAKPDMPGVRVMGIAEMNYVLVFIGCGLGSSLRHTVNVVSARYLVTAFPYHTFIINITGSIVMGLIA